MIGIPLLILESIGLDVTGFLSTLIGSNVSATKLLLSILLAYPIAIYYDENIKKRNSLDKKLYFFLTGLDIGVYNFGLDMYHMFVPIIVFYVTMKVFGPGKVHTIFTFIFTMSYLMVGYFYTESEHYDITWTMPFCILVLRLIAVAFDLWDGVVPEENLSSSFKKTALRSEPSLLDLLACCFFPASLLVGPQFSMIRFNEFVSGKFDQHRGHTKAAVYTLLLGVLYLAIYQLLTIFFPTDYMLTDEFAESGFWYKHIYIGVWGKGTLSKYIACWLIAEAACTRFQLSYQHFDSSHSLTNSLNNWDGCNNIKICTFECATRFGHYIESFNVNTNLWSAQYIYKRCAFLGNKYISQGLTIFFLAVWHGLHSGYYMTFAMEFIIMFMEKEYQPILEKYKWYHSLWGHPVSASILFAVLKVYTFVFMGWCMIPFDFKCSDKWWQVYSSLNYSGFVLFFSLICLPKVLPKVMPAKKSN